MGIKESVMIKTFLQRVVKPIGAFFDLYSKKDIQISILNACIKLHQEMIDSNDVGDDSKARLRLLIIDFEKELAIRLKEVK
jgi:hypothetical protein